VIQFASRWIGNSLCCTG